MVKVTNIQFWRILSCVALLAWTSGCSRPSAEQANDVALTIDQAGTGNSSGDPVADGFKLTLYPVVKKNCSVCHTSVVSPFFAADDMAAAMKVVVDSHLADLTVPEESRLVKRLSVQSHNCWSDCIANSQEMGKAIREWASKAAGSVVNSNGLTAQTAAVAITAVETKKINGENGTYVVEAEEAQEDLKGKFDVIADPVASKGKVLTVKGPADPNVRRRALFQFEIEKDGIYELWGRTKAPTNNNRQMLFVLDDQQQRAWTIDQNAGDMQWEKAQRNEAQNTLVTPIHMEPGTHTLELFPNNQTDFEIDMIALTSNTSFSGANEANVGEVKVLDYDISALVGGKKAHFEIEVDVKDSSYVFRSPRIFTEKDSIQVKGIYILVNGKFNPQYRTFASAAATVAAPGGDRLSTATMIVLKENADGSDQITIGFEVLK